ncbi:MAG TPA: NepR family anti-sigma factor [Dongiaceae bacterium]|nr:NepR family anti-sigma factor [Dongiaceae bacterium]
MESKPSKTPPSPSVEGPSKQPRHRDRWFDSQLLRLYNDVVNEPLPDELSQLVTKLQNKMAGSND